MSAENGNGSPPPAPPAQEVPILKETTYTSQQTTAERGTQGALVSFVVIEGGQPVRHSYKIGEQGKRELLEVLSGGLALP